MYERDYHKSVLQDEKQSKQKKRTKKFPWKNIIVITVCVLLVGGFVVLTQLDRLQVRTVEVVGANSADPKDVAQFVIEDLSGHWLYVFPKTSIVLLPDTSLEKTIKRAFPKFETVSVSRSGTQTITVTVTEYAGVHVWCESGTSECSFMSAQGVVFASAPFFSGSAYVKIFAGSRGEYPFYPVSDEQLSTVNFMLERLRAINIEPSEFHFYTYPDRLEIVFYHNGSPARLIIDSDVSSDTSLQSLFTALRTPPLSTRYRDGISVLQYIDVRLPSKVVYKFQ